MYTLEQQSSLLPAFLYVSELLIEYPRMTFLYHSSNEKGVILKTSTSKEYVLLKCYKVIRENLENTLA